MYIKVGSQTDAQNLSNLLKDGDWMVLYYAEWCGHCTTMKPEWKKVADKMNTNNKINVAEIESTHIDDLVDKPKIDGFPTIKMYNSGKEVAKFEDERIADNIEKFALSNSTKEKKPSKPIISPKPKKERKKKASVKKIDIDPSKLPTPQYIAPTPAPANTPANVPAHRKSQSSSKSIINKDCSNYLIPKICKSTGNCTFDYNIKKCVDKPKPKLKSKKSHKVSAHKSSSHKSSAHKSSARKSSARKSSSYIKKTVKKTKRDPKSKNNNNNMRKATHSVFGKLINSFERIGKEAQTDAQLLKEAKHLL
jgi:thiol-disulfide isomerase/thioredoxin